ncbi:MAG: hypothetical protein R2787_01275 [Saprospiraceae bacterium]
MKRMAVFAGILMMLTLVSCDNELDLVSDWKEIPVVYGFLSRSDTAQYIRVEKAFLDPATSAFVIAKNPDSLYFQRCHCPAGRHDYRQQGHPDPG